MEEIKLAQSFATPPSIGILQSAQNRTDALQRIPSNIMPATLTNLYGFDRGHCRHHEMQDAACQVVHQCQLRCCKKKAATIKRSKRHQPCCQHYCD